MWPLTRAELAPGGARPPSAQLGARWRGQQRTARRWCAPRAPEFDEVRIQGGLEFGLLAAQPALGLGELDALPRPHSDQVRFDSAIIPRTLNSSRRTGSVGSCTEPRMFSLTSAPVILDDVAASVKDRASRSSCVTPRVSPDRHAASASRSSAVPLFLNPAVAGAPEPHSAPVFWSGLQRLQGPSSQNRRQVLGRCGGAA